MAPPGTDDIRKRRRASAARSHAMATLLALFLVVTLPASAVKPDPPDVPPESVVSSFYTLCIKEHVTGLPTEEQFESMREMLSDRILGLIDDARMEQAEFSRENPGDKPPWIEGDLFSSLFEGPTRFAAGTAVVERDRATVTVSFVHVGTDDGKPFEWKDDVFLVIDVNNEWKIDDVEYRGDWDFAPRGRLSEALRIDQPD